MTDKNPHAEPPSEGNNPNAESSGGGINPSAPSTGLAGRGNTFEERHQSVGQNNPEASSPDAQGAGNVRHASTSYPQNEAQNPEAHAKTHHSRSLRCADVLTQGCDWSVTGNNDEELLGYMRSHARAAHGKSEFTSWELENARRAILKRAA